ncbi:hypothetical protein MSG28_010046 [Choristoneura fumiferana]|uniref:Uncharacterized protein n=1 Tax=Choristoneura fumiferana TaxID=7141 RepID=A0ACC0KK34_CHOFU|nr:hypothetical protein MSG28_010046 [Choristoneura fumiferana]
MSKSNKIVVHVPDDYIARSCEIVNRWLDKNEKYLNSFPPEHDEITKIEDFRFSRRNRQWNRPVLSSYLPTSSVRVRAVKGQHTQRAGAGRARARDGVFAWRYNGRLHTERGAARSCAGPRPSPVITNSARAERRVTNSQNIYP